MTTSARFLMRIPALAMALALVAATAPAATFKIINMDGPGEGFNDPTPRAPVGGNPGTTVGQQRLNVMQRAADTWGGILGSSVEIAVEAVMDPLDCNATSALLGSAGPIGVFRNITGEPRAATWYHSALANAIKGSDLDPDADITARFNSSLGTPGCLGGADWYYGFDNNPTANTINFLSTVLHEYAHGLGFSTFVNRDSGAKFMGFDDIYMAFLEDHSTGKKWPEMTNTERKASAIDTRDLHWTGANVIASALTYAPEPGAATVLTGGVHPSGHVEMYAPDPFEGGSSVSHWNTNLTPNELMEPFDAPFSTDIVTTPLFKDEGWSISGGPTGPCVADATTLCLLNGRYQARVNWRTKDGSTGSGQAVPFTSGSGLLYFFDADNIEMLIKVLDACPVNDRHWVFFAATTNVEFTVRVTDTQTGRLKTYMNPLDHPANAVTDTSAFPSCGSSATTPGELFTSAGAVGTEELASRVAAESADLEAFLDAGVLRSTAASAAKVGVRSLATASPMGTTYEVEPNLSADINGNGVTDGDELFTLQPLGGNGNVVTYDGKRENLKQYVQSLAPNTTPGINEAQTTVNAVSVGSALTETLRLTITMDTANGNSFWPDGFVDPTTQTPLTDGVFVIGFFTGSDPLDFTNRGVKAATFTMMSGSATVATVTLSPAQVAAIFGSGPWDGDLAIVFSDVTDLSVNKLVAVIDVEVDKETTTVPPFTCVPDATTLCLNGGRFQVKVNFVNPQGQTVAGTKTDIPGSATSGLFYFFDSNNIEMLIKLLNGCGINNKYWTFFAATTDVGFTVTVTDAKTGVQKVYTNVKGHPADAVTDVNAFATCP